MNHCIITLTNEKIPGSNLFIILTLFYLMDFEEFKNKKEEHLLGGGIDKQKQHKAKEKMNAFERMTLLFDSKSFIEIDPFVTHECFDFNMEKKKILGDGVVTGYGLINSRLAYAFCHDFTVFGGSLGLSFANKVCKIMDLALKQGVPIIGINDSGGARIQEGIASLAGYAEIFRRNVKASGIVPQISLIMGPCAGGAVYSPAITDFIIMTKSSFMFVTGPEVVKEVTNETVTFNDLGGAQIHNEKSGVAHFLAEDEQECLRILYTLLSFIPSNNLENPPRIDTKDNPLRENEELNSFLPTSTTKPYDMEWFIKKVIDNGDFLEVQRHWARNIIIGFARLDGNPIGIVANNPEVLAGVLDIDSCDKATRFVRFCDCFNIPLVALVDVPGFLPGTEQEWRGIIRHGAKLLYAFSEATVPKLTVIIRKAYGGAYCVMNSKHIGADYNFAWPNAEIAVMGPESACTIIFKNEISNSSKPKEKKIELIEQYRTKFSNPYIAASKGYIDDIIEPKDTRKRLISALKSIYRKREEGPRRKHGNIPV
ncbi:MAG TPA: acyl-CoA carboxylase subunit beta [Nitrososphaeraceae archaeon]|nr:acyl-CoA carboxylase subunit beta [Nitrososphaeraceae archaeon]